MILTIPLMIVGIYIILQALWSVYFLIRAKTLTLHTHAGTFNLGDAKNPAFDILIDGDSVGAGMGASSFETSLAGRIGNFYKDKYHVSILDNAVAGYTMHDLVNKKIPDVHRNLIVLVISSNDLLHFSDLKQFKDDTKIVLERYSKDTDKLIIIGPGRVFDAIAIPLFLKPIYISQGKKYGKIIHDIAKQYPNVIHVNPQEVSVDHKKYGSTGASDGFHPNDEGHRFWFDLLKPFL